MERCDLCGKEANDTIHLPIYISGSEGIEACLACRIILSKVAEGIKSAANRARKQGFILARGEKKILKNIPDIDPLVETLKEDAVY